MCGRFTLTTPDLQSLAAGLDLPPEAFAEASFEPRYNIAPTDQHLIVRIENEDFRALNAKWGLVNVWAKDAKGAARQINARVETAHSRNAFKDAFRKRRCVVPADGYYEWTGPKEVRQPHWFHREDRKPFLMAGLYESWSPEPGQPQRTFTIITTDSNETVAPIHDRMPVVLPDERLEAWLTRDEDDIDKLRELLVPAPNDLLVPLAVSPRANSVKNDDPSVLESAEIAEQPALFDEG